MIILTVVGHVGNDPEVKHVGEKNTPVLRFNVASNSVNPDDPPTWVRVSYFGDRGQKIAGFIHKGDRIAVSGRGKLRTWSGDAGPKTDLELDATDVQLIEKKDESRQSAAPAQQQRQAAAPAQNGGARRANRF